MKRRKQSRDGCDSWYVTWSCGHLELLEESLPLADWPRDRILVVDYSCPDDAGDWVESKRFGKVLRVDARMLADGTPLVSRARALNFALAELSERYVVLGDPQLYPLAGARARVVALAAEHPESAVVSPDGGRALMGLVAARSTTIIGAGGYLSAYVGHGAESIDLRLRLLRHNVTLVTEALPFGVATGHKARIWGSAALLERRLGMLYGEPGGLGLPKLLGFPM